MLFTNMRYGKKFAKDPAVAYFNGKYFLYHSIFDNDRRLRVDIAESSDGENWELALAPLPLDDDHEKNGIGAPAAIVIGDKLHLFYQTYGNRERDAICHAVSTDGINFIKDETNPVFHPTDDWCCGRAIDADVCLFGDKLFLYFATRDKEFEIQKLGCAAASADSSFCKSDFVQMKAGTILNPELGWEQKCIEAPAAIVKGEKVFMFYGGAYNCCPQQIGCAVSNDGIDFLRISDKPLLTNGKEGDWNESESGHPYVFTDTDGTDYLYYQGSPDKGKSWFLSRKKINWLNGLPVIE